MACGTPVIAWRRGSIPEIVDHGVTGFIVENETEAVEAITTLDRLDRRNIRRVFEQRFTAQRMAQNTCTASKTWPREVNEFIHQVIRKLLRASRRRGKLLPP
jgi:glycosyltransferase involved in cell wall biosynthesis